MAAGINNVATIARDILENNFFAVKESAEADFVGVSADLRKATEVLVLNEDDELVGIISVRDLARYFVMRGVPYNVPIGQLMIRDVVTAGANTPIAELAALMLSKEVGSVVILDCGELAGIVTKSDFVKLWED